MPTVTDSPTENASPLPARFDNGSSRQTHGRPLSSSCPLCPPVSPRLGHSAHSNSCAYLPGPCQSLFIPVGGKLSPPTSDSAENCYSSSWPVSFCTSSASCLGAYCILLASEPAFSFHLGS